MTDFIEVKIGGQPSFNQAGLPNITVFSANFLAGDCGFIEHFLAYFLALDQLGLNQLFQRIINRVGIVDVQHKSNVGQPFFTGSMVYIV